MDINKDDITGVLAISGRLDIATAESLQEVLLDCLSHQPEVTLDLGAVDACDTAALQVLLAARQSSAAIGKSFRFTQISGALTETAMALGFSIESTPGTAGGVANR